MTRPERAAILRNPPPGWGRLFAPVPGRSGKVRCLLCGSKGYGQHGRTADAAGPDGRPYYRPAPWQAPHIAGHPERCGTCRRPFSSTLSLSSHQTCKLHHACCHDHTSVPEWANPFRTREPAS